MIASIMTMLLIKLKNKSIILLSTAFGLKIIQLMSNLPLVIFNKPLWMAVITELICLRKFRYYLSIHQSTTKIKINRKLDQRLKTNSNGLSKILKKVLKPEENLSFFLISMLELASSMTTHQKCLISGQILTILATLTSSCNIHLS